MIRIVARTLATTNRRAMDPIQAIFVNKIRAYRDQSSALGGPVGADGVFKQEQADIMERLSRTYGRYYIYYITYLIILYLGGGDMESFPSLDFVEPDLHQDAIDGERTIDIQVGQ